MSPKSMYQPSLLDDLHFDCTSLTLSLNRDVHFSFIYLHAQACISQAEEFILLYRYSCTPRLSVIQSAAATKLTSALLGFWRTHTQDFLLILLLHPTTFPSAYLARFRSFSALILTSLLRTGSLRDLLLSALSLSPHV